MQFLTHKVYKYLALKCVKQNLLEGGKKEVDKSTVGMRDFNTSVSKIN